MTANILCVSFGASEMPGEMYCVKCTVVVYCGVEV